MRGQKYLKQVSPSNMLDHENTTKGCSFMGCKLGQQSVLEVPTLPAYFSDPVYSTASQRVLLTQQDGKVWCSGKKEAGFTAEAKSCETTP